MNAALGALKALGFVENVSTENAAELESDDADIAKLDKMIGPIGSLASVPFGLELTPFT